MKQLSAWEEMGLKRRMNNAACNKGGNVAAT